MAISEVHVDEVDALGMNLNEDFVMFRKWIRDRTIFKNLRPANRCDLNAFMEQFPLCS